MSFEASNGGSIADFNCFDVVDSVPAAADNVRLYGDVYDISFFGSTDGMSC